MLWSLQLALWANYSQCNNAFLTGKQCVPIPHNGHQGLGWGSEPRRGQSQRGHHHVQQLLVQTQQAPLEQEHSTSGRGSARWGELSPPAGLCHPRLGVSDIPTMPGP